MSVSAVVAVRRTSIRLVTLTTCFFAFAGVRPAKSQSLDPQPAPQSVQKKPAFERTTDVSLGVFGQLTPDRINVGTFTATNVQSGLQTSDWTTASTGVLAGLHQQFKPWLGYKVHLGYTRSTWNYSTAYSYASTQPSPLGGNYSYLLYNSVGTNMYEVSVMAAVQGPHEKRFSTFAEAGGGLLTFLPTKRPSTTAVQVRPAAPFGVGLNYRLSDHWGLRGEYRAQFCKTPDFKDPGRNPDKRFTVTSEPTLSLVYTFGGHKKSQAVTH